MATKTFWQALALGCARDAHENNFPSRRGVYGFSDANALCLYNNNPWAHDSALRDLETAEFRQRLAEAGIPKLAYATYPPPGEEGAGYTYAMIIGAGADRVAWVKETMYAILIKTHGLPGAEH